MKLKQYLYSQLAITFFPIFFGLYFITSVVFLVKIASLTSIITINFFELFTLYTYVVPQIVFYTVPISFFISLVITLSKLASEYELTVITSFGLNPLKVMRVFAPLTILLSISLIVVSIGLIPKTKFLTKQFLDVKKKEANFNIKASEFGQKFGDWLIYIQNKDDKTYEQIKLFKTQNEKDQFIISQSAVLKNDKGDLSFKLDNGKAFFIDEKEINQVNFESMLINDSIANSRMGQFTTTYDYWKVKIKKGEDIDDFTFFILTSIFPTISLFLVIAFGYFNPRYEKNKAVMYSLIAVVIYYVIAKPLGKELELHSLYILPLIWLVGTYYIYSKTVKKEY
ncbi:LptF/LptG family permease [Arcobacter sp. YIC-310]|uniref:LptF/LptG family permease n=1 Tax=Arcobacter sp. YIC-310 TaxID=3376632 RepID=UPI003C19C873